MRLNTLLNLCGTASASAAYHYIPVEFDYGANSRVTANFTFGTAPDAEPVKVVMDSGSANFWVFSMLTFSSNRLTRCKLWAPNAIVHWGSQYLGVEGPCNETVPISYDPSTSPTSTQTNESSSYAYAGNAKIVQGAFYANDTLTSTGGSIPDVQFALENYGLFRQLDDGTCRQIEYDQAILGLSPFTNTTAGPSFRQSLFDAGQIASKTMVMWFNAHLGALGRLTGGVLFGAIDMSKFMGDLVRVSNVVSEYEIGIYVNKPTLEVGGVVFDLDEDTTCLVDSGAHADYLPFDYTTNTSSVFFASTGLVDYNGVVAFNGTCESIPQSLNLTYTFAGVDSSQSVSIDVPLRNYARGLNYTGVGTEGLCLLNLEIGGCMFGAPFLSGAMLALDDSDNSVGLAQGGVSQEGSGVDESALKIIGAGQSWDTV